MNITHNLAMITFKFIIGSRAAKQCTSGVRRKFSWWGFGSRSYGGYLYLVCAVCDVTIWRHFHVSKPTFRRSLL